MFEQLLNLLTVPTIINTLGGQTHITIVSDNNNLNITNAGGTVFTVDAELFNSVYTRYNELDPQIRYQTSQYSLPNWEACPNMIICPYIAAIISEYENI